MGNRHDYIRHKYKSAVEALHRLADMSEAALVGCTVLPLYIESWRERGKLSQRKSGVHGIFGRQADRPPSATFSIMETDYHCYYLG
jgi:hypothetical protein